MICCVFVIRWCATNHTRCVRYEKTGNGLYEKEKCSYCCCVFWRKFALFLFCFPYLACSHAGRFFSCFGRMVIKKQLMQGGHTYENSSSKKPENFVGSIKVFYGV